MASPTDPAVHRAFPPVPAYAWAWLQRSRPVLAEAAKRLTGQPPTPGFVERLRVAVDRDPFTAAVLADAIVDAAFHGRVPRQRPPGASWDRGLTWWAAALTGTSPAAYAAPPVPPAQQRALFDSYSEHEGVQVPPPPGPALAGGWERRALADALRELLRASDGDQVPASAVRQLLDALEPS